MSVKKSLGMVMLVFCWMACYSQEVIPLSNPSFEGLPRVGTVRGPAPLGWQDCGKPGESAPDIQPGFFNVEKPATHGATYLGLVVRDNDTWEAVSQHLEAPLQANKCYTMTMFLSRSEKYLSPAREAKDDSIPHVQAAKIRIWGGRSRCSKLELLDETEPITSTTWKGYSFRFEPMAYYTHIMIEAFYKTPVLFPYNGNVLVDNLSDISMIPCDDPTPDPPVYVEPEPDPVIASVDPPKPTPEPPTSGGANNNPPKPTPEPPKNGGKLGNTEVTTVGQTIKIENLNFPADSFSIVSSNYPILEDLYQYMIANPLVKIEVGGHTNNRCQSDYCNTLSQKRAKSVVDYLIRKGIRSTRLTYKGYGSRRPIATNQTTDGRKKNQRVEVKIMSLDG